MERNSSVALKKTSAPRQLEQVTLTRADICRSISQKLGFSQAEAVELLDGVLDSVAKGLQSSGVVKLTGFGNFVVRKKAARVGRNPKTNIEAVISPRNAISFSSSNLLKKRIN